MISVEDAIGRIVAACAPLEAEVVPVEHADGRVLSEDVTAKLDQPPFPVSAMDGYAVRAEDVATVPARLRVIGSAPAGHPFEGRLAPGQAVRIFTGAVLPEGADAVVVQEDALRDGELVVVNETAVAGRHIRKRGLDFAKGARLAARGRRLGPRDLALIAAGDVASVPVRRKPRVGFAATGDELSRPGNPRKAGGIVASSGYGLSAMIARWGGEPRDLGILPDTVDALAALPERAAHLDMVVTMGGVSVGDHDLVQTALAPRGFVLDFWKIAMRPGKPLIFGRLGTKPFLGLPGNPVSSLVCAILFLKPAIGAMLGCEGCAELRAARSARALPANDGRQDYLRAALSLRKEELWAEAYAIQDSSMQSTLAAADCLIVRPPRAQAVPAGGWIEVLPLDEIWRPSIPHIDR